MKTSTKIWLGVGAFVVAGSGAAATQPAVAAPALPSVERPPMDARVPTPPPTSTSAIVLAQHTRHSGEREGGEGEGGEGGEGERGGEGGEGERGGEGGEGERGQGKGRAGEGGGERGQGEGGEGEGGEGEGGEGEGGEGEGGEGGGAGLSPELQFGLRIAQLRGHLLVGDQLVREKQWNAAMPHFLHPTEEIYDSIRGRLKDYGVPPFESALKALADTVKRKKGGADYANAFAAVQDALAKADAGLKDQGANWGPFTVDVALELLKSAAGEYKEAIVKGHIAKPVEYQDARGFVWQAEAMIDSIAGELEKKDGDALKRVRGHLADLKTVFPTATPPARPVKNQADVLATIARVELAASPLM